MDPSNKNMLPKSAWQLKSAHACLILFVFEVSHICHTVIVPVGVERAADKPRWILKWGCPSC